MTVAELKEMFMDPDYEVELEMQLAGLRSVADMFGIPHETMTVKEVREVMKRIGPGDEGLND